MIFDGYRNDAMEELISKKLMPVINFRSIEKDLPFNSKIALSLAYSSVKENLFVQLYGNTVINCELGKRTIDCLTQT